MQRAGKMPVLCIVSCMTPNARLLNQSACNIFIVNILGGGIFDKKTLVVQKIIPTFVYSKKVSAIVWNIFCGVMIIFAVGACN